MDSVCDLDLSTSYMLSVSRVAESCTGKKIEENSFSLPLHMIEKRKKLWEAIESKYSITEDDTCEVAFEIETNTVEHREYAAEEFVSCHKTKWSNFTKPLRPNLRKRKLKNRDAVQADMWWKNENQLHSSESRVPQCVQQATVSYDKGIDVEDFCENLQDDCRAEILSGSIKLLRNKSLKQLKDVSNGGDKLSDSHSSLKKHTGTNTVAVFGNELNVFAEKIPTIGGDEKEMTVEVLAANKEVSVEHITESSVPALLETCKQECSFGKEVRKCLSPCEGNVEVNVKNPKSLTLDSHGANFTCVRNASPSLEATRKCGVHNASKLVPYASQRYVLRSVSELNAMIHVAFENMPLSLLKMFGSNLQLWTPRIILRRCEREPIVNNNTYTCLDSDVPTENLSESDKALPNSSALCDCENIYFISKEVSVSTDVTCGNVGNGQEPLNKCHRISEDCAESCVEKCGETLNEVPHCRELESTECNGNTSTATCNDLDGNTKDFSKCKACQAGNVENGEKFKSGYAMLRQKSSGCSLSDFPKGVEDECFDNKDTRSSPVKPLFMPMNTEMCGRNVGDTAKTKEISILQTSKVLLTKYKPLIPYKTDSVSDVKVKSVSSDSDRTILPGNVKNEKTLSMQGNQKEVLITVNTLDKQSVTAESDVSDTTSSAPYEVKYVNTDEINKENIKPSSSPFGSSKLMNCDIYLRSCNLKKESVACAEICGGVSNKVFGNTKVIEPNNYTFTKQVSKGVHSHKNPLQKTKVDYCLSKHEGTLRFNLRQNSFHKRIQRTCEKVVSYGASHHKEMLQEVQCSAVSPIQKTKLEIFKSRKRKYLIPSNSKLKFELKSYKGPNENTKKEKKRFCMKVVSSKDDKRACTHDFSV